MRRRLNPYGVAYILVGLLATLRLFGATSVSDGEGCEVSLLQTSVTLQTVAASQKQHAEDVRNMLELSQVNSEAQNGQTQIPDFHDSGPLLQLESQERAAQTRIPDFDISLAQLQEMEQGRNVQMQTPQIGRESSHLPVEEQGEKAHTAFQFSGSVTQPFTRDQGQVQDPMFEARASLAQMQTWLTSMEQQLQTRMQSFSEALQEQSTLHQLQASLSAMDQQLRERLKVLDGASQAQLEVVHLQQQVSQLTSTLGAKPKWWMDRMDSRSSVVLEQEEASVQIGVLTKHIQRLQESIAAGASNPSLLQNALLEHSSIASGVDGAAPTHTVAASQIASKVGDISLLERLWTWNVEASTFLQQSGLFMIIFLLLMVISSCALGVLCANKTQEQHQRGGGVLKFLRVA